MRVVQCYLLTAYLNGPGLCYCAASSFSQHCHCVISKVSKFRAPCSSRKFCGSAVLGRWMWSAGVTVSCQSLWVFFEPKCPECPQLERTENTAREPCFFFFSHFTLFLLLPKKQAKQNTHTARLGSRLKLTPERSVCDGKKTSRVATPSLPRL